MTISPQDQPSQAVANYDSDYTGLEEFGAEDMVTPRLSILHKDGMFKDSLTNQTFKTMHVIILGLVKQRILWPDRQDEGDKPMCRSNDHKTGFVNIKLTDKPANKQFPWPQSNFDPAQQVLDSEGRLQLPCDGCELKEWGSHPDAKRPFCSELFTLPVMYDPSLNGNWVPALITLKTTQLKPLRAYLSAFQRMGTPPFQVYTQMDLDVVTRGQNPYSIPRFAMGTQTDPNAWVEYAQNSRTMAQYLRTPPRVDEATPAPVAAAPAANAWGGPQQAPVVPAGDPWGQAAAAQPETIVHAPIPAPVAPQAAAAQPETTIIHAPIPANAPQAAPAPVAAPVPPPVAPGPVAAPVAPQAQAPAAPQEAAAAPVPPSEPNPAQWGGMPQATPQEPVSQAPAPVAAPVAPTEQAAVPAPSQSDDLPF